MLQNAVVLLPWFFLKSSIPTMRQLCLLILLFLLGDTVFAQQLLRLQDAVDIAVKNYGTIQAKAAYTKAAQANVDETKREALPDVLFGVQQAYGTVNGLNGPIYGLGGVTSINAGLQSNTQNWNAAFGALYLTNVNWNFFAFGRAKKNIKTAEAQEVNTASDYEQELFEHKIRVAAAYLNLVAAQQLRTSFQKNLSRADTLKLVVTAKAFNGLIAGVDSSQANAESSAARITLTNAIDAEQERSNQLAQLMGVTTTDFLLDTSFVSVVPSVMQADTSLLNHPVLKYYKSRIDVSKQQAAYLKTFAYPTFSLLGVFQGRSSGFGNGYTTDHTDFSKRYWDGINPNRYNYLVGVGVTWSFTQALRVAKQVQAQNYTSKGLQAEYELAGRQLKAQLQLSDTKIKNALNNYYEAPVQVRAAADAYLQRTVLYKNGLTDIVDVTQAAYALIRAETDRDIANNNVWQALLLKAAATGDFNVFVSQVK